MKITAKSAATLVLMSVGTLAACVRDEIADCPPLQVDIAVKDKNYFNVDIAETEQRKPDDLPFREYVPTIYYVVRDLESGDIVEESTLMDVDKDDKMFSISLNPDIPHGKYVLTVWGGMSDLGAITDNGCSFRLTPDNQQGEDVYMTNDTLVYDARHNRYRVELERTKGKLIIENVCEGQAEGINVSRENVSGLFSGVDNAFKYSGMTSVTMEHSWTASARVVTKSILPPSVEEGGSTLHMVFFNREASDDMPFAQSDVNITMRRNELTMLRYVWDSNEEDATIYMFVNDNWKVVNAMEVE